MYSIKIFYLHVCVCDGGLQELVSGGELFEKIVEVGSYTEPDAANIVKQVSFVSMICINIHCVCLYDRWWTVWLTCIKTASLIVIWSQRCSMHYFCYHISLPLIFFLYCCFLFSTLLELVGWWTKRRRNQNCWFRLVKSKNNHCFKTISSFITLFFVFL